MFIKLITENTPTMAKQDNLKPQWQKGQSGNPKGRPKGSLNRSTIAKKWLEVNEKIKNPITGDSEVLSQEDAITLALINKARKGDVNAYRALLDSGYGKPKESVDVTQFVEQPLFEDVPEDYSSSEDTEARQED